jgi:hypothetical protein
MPIQTPNKKIKTTRLFCNNCKTTTNHTLKASHKQHYDEGDPDGSVFYWGESEFLFWVCAGCDTGVLEERSTDAGMLDNNGTQIYESRYWPKRDVHDLKEKHFRELPSKLRLIYHETILAFNNGLYILTTAGLRALIEGICSDKKVGGDNLMSQINNLTTLLPANIVHNLHRFRFMGNDAVHELSTPKTDDLIIAIEVSEDLLNFLYELDYKTSRLPKPKNISPKPKN